jgi:hypothetical protein
VTSLETTPNASICMSSRGETVKRAKIPLKKKKENQRKLVLKIFQLLTSQHETLGSVAVYLIWDSWFMKWRFHIFFSF